MKKIDVVAIIGPTASGKTALSIKLAKEIDGEVINGDSMQIYKKMDIGTAKITTDEMEGVPHHLLSFKDPTDSFSVAEYQRLVREKITEIQARGKMPIIVGGTGLYVQSVLYDFVFSEEKVDGQARQDYYAELEKIGPEAMHAKLMEIDPVTAETIHPNNTRRVIRALEMVELTGSSKADEAHNRGDVPLYNHLIIGMDVDREILYDRINRRVDSMLEQGLEAEVAGLYNAGIRDAQSIKAIGYKEFYAYFEQRATKEETVDAIKQNSRRYAKRQLTYFRNKMNVQWIGHRWDIIKTFF